MAIAFLIAGVAWVLVTDLLIYRFIANPATVTRLETAKGWVFVALASAAVYLLAARAVHRIARANATLEAVFSSISDGVLILNRDGSIRDANPAAASLLNVKDPRELVGMDGPAFARRFLVSFPDGRVLEPERYVSQRALAGESPPPTKEVLHPPGGGEVVAIVTGAPVRPIPDGPVALAVSVIHDITLAESIDRMRDEFIASAAHTLRTPISIISAQTHLLVHGLARSPHTSAQMIDRQCRRMTRVTENLFVLARLRSGTLRLETERVDLAEIAAGAARDMAHASAEHELQSAVRAHPIVFGDHERLQLVARNLIELAIRRARPCSLLALDVDEAHLAGRLAITYEPSYDDDAAELGRGFAGLGLERYVLAELVEATRGRAGSDLFDHRRTDWVEIPTVEDAPRG